MNSDIQTQISLLGTCYTKLTGFQLRHSGACNPRERFWFEWIKAGFTISDLETVILWLKGRIRSGVRRPECLKFHNLIEDPFRFEEELQLAKAEKRNAKPAPSPHEKVVSAFRACDPVPPITDAKHVSELIQNLRAAAGMPLTKPNQ